jgi:hypothetical protein
VSPLQKRCTSTPHEEATLPFVMVALAMAVTIAIVVAISVATADSIAIAVTIAIAVAIAVAVAVAIAIAHRCCQYCWPLPLQSPSTIAAAISVTLPSAIAVAITLAVGYCRLRHRRQSQLPLPSAITIAMPLAISESCCLGAARIVFDQLKQRMLTLFYCAWTVGGALVEAGLLTRCRAVMANTSVGWQAVSSERLVRKVAGSMRAAGGQKGGDVD